MAYKMLIPARLTEGLTVSLVTFKPDLDLLEQTLISLRAAVREAGSSGLGSNRLVLVDNSPGDGARTQLTNLVSACWGNDWDLLTPGFNAGFGQGHNLAIAKACGDYHLILNPDVELAKDAIAEAVVYLASNPSVGCISPYCEGPNHQREYLCKRYPSITDLGVRGFLPPFLQSFCQKRLARYELREETEDMPAHNVPIASGCFMFFRREALLQAGGFSPDHFLYFEDFDLSLRVGKYWSIAYVPSVKIIHHGGYAARKGVYHVLLFARSGLIFFSKHGWKWW